MEPLEAKELSEDFTGLRHRVLSDGVVQISCLGVVRALIPLVHGHPVHRSCEVEVPMARNTPLMLRLKDGGSHSYLHQSG